MTIRVTILFAVPFLVVGCGEAPIDPPQVGDVAPAFSLKNAVTQDDFDSESLKGQVVVLNFWGTDCANCMKEIEDLKAIESSGRAKVVGISIDGSSEKINKIIKAKEINYSVLKGGQDIFAKYDGYGIPYTLVLDKSLVVRKMVSGRMKKDEFEKLLDEI